LWQYRLLMPGWGDTGVANIGNDAGDGTILPVQRLAALGIIPRQSRQPTLDRRQGLPFASGGPGGQRGYVEADDLRVGRQERVPLPSAPTRKLLPVRLIGAASVGGTGRHGRAEGGVGRFFPMSR